MERQEEGKGGIQEGGDHERKKRDGERGGGGEEPAVLNT